jgi:hypothetical protein
MKVCYLLQTHKNPNQIYRLVHTLKQLSPAAQIILNHDFTNCELDRAKFETFSHIQIIPSQGGRGNFSLVQSYLEATQWLLNHVSDFDWLIHLTGQDYPIHPLADVERFLLETHYDGFLEYFQVFSQESPWKAQEGYTRYFYQYRTLSSNLSDWQKELLRPIKILNYFQPFIRVNSSYGLTLGLKTSVPFNSEFVCYGGSFLCILSRECINYLHKFVELNPGILNHYKGVANPDESFIQTVLINSQLFNLCNDSKRYFDFSGTRNGHPRVLSAEDFPKLVESQAYFARKFDLNQDSSIFDLIDEYLLKLQETEIEADNSLGVSNSQGDFNRDRALSGY